jgi:hypothetical protein
MDQAAILDHQFRIAAYVVTWVIQLGYLTWLGVRWQAQKRDAARLSVTPLRPRRQAFAAERATPPSSP